MLTMLKGMKVIKVRIYIELTRRHVAGGKSGDTSKFTAVFLCHAVH